MCRIWTVMLSDTLHIASDLWILNSTWSRQTTHEVTEARGILSPQLDHKLVIQTDLRIQALVQKCRLHCPVLHFRRLRTCLAMFSWNTSTSCMAMASRVDPTKPLCNLHGRPAQYRDWHTNIWADHPFYIPRSVNMTPNTSPTVHVRSENCLLTWPLLS